jgi:hypothetical protein
MAKKNILYLCLILFIVFLVITNKDTSRKSSGGTSDYGRRAEISCSINGYDECYGYTDSDNNGIAKATAEARLGESLSNPDVAWCSSIGKTYALVNKYKFNYSCRGTNTRASFDRSSSTGECSNTLAYSCSGQEIDRTGEIILNPTPSYTIEDINVYCWAYQKDVETFDGNTDTAEVSVWVTSGYSIPNNYVSLNCCTNNDCGSGYKCDTSDSSYLNWNCAVDLCYNVACPDTCSGNILNYGGKCNLGSCSYTSSKVCSSCSNGICTSNNSSINNSQNITTDCTSNNDCNQNTCFGSTCVNNKCVQNTGSAAPTCTGEEYYGQLSSWSGYPTCKWSCKDQDEKESKLGLYILIGVIALILFGLIFRRYIPKWLKTKLKR